MFKIVYHVSLIVTTVGISGGGTVNVRLHTIEAESLTDMISDILRRDGGFVDHEADRGGPANLGIALKPLAEWRGAGVSRGQVEALTEQ